MADAWALLVAVVLASLLFCFVTLVGGALIGEYCVRRRTADLVWFATQALAFVGAVVLGLRVLVLYGVSPL